MVVGVDEVTPEDNEETHDDACVERARLRASVSETPVRTRRVREAVG
jgi:hypothetical protein